MLVYGNIVSNAEQLKLNNPYDRLCNPCFLLIAYVGVKKNMAVELNNVEGVNATLEMVCIFYQKNFLLNSGECIPIQRLHIEKPQSGKRLLELPSMCIVQKAFQISSQLAFEWNFSKHSHRFRLNWSCQRCFGYLKGN